MPANATFSKWTGMITIIAGSVAVAAQDSHQPAAGLDQKVDKILTRLEQRTINDIQAKVSWSVKDMIAGSSVEKKGDIWYRTMKPAAKFLVAFDEKIDHSRNRKRKLTEKHMFDGRWYIELQQATKTFTRRELRRENEVGNPYALGDGLFPLPFGQKKADILKEFEVAVMEPSNDDPAKTDHLRLTPRAGTRTGNKYVWIDFWVLQTGKLSGLPVQVRLGKKEGTGHVSEEVTVKFTDVRLNKGFSPSIFDIKKPPGYHSPPDKLLPPVDSTPQP